MKLSRFFAGMLVGTILALSYVQLQVQIFDLAYQGKHKEKLITKLMDDNGDVKSNISQLQSANHLGDRLLDDRSSLQFLSQDQIVKLSTTYDFDNLPAKSPRTVQVAEKRSNFLASIFSVKSQAEAGPIR